MKLNLINKTNSNSVGSMIRNDFINILCDFNKPIITIINEIKDIIKEELLIEETDINHDLKMELNEKEFYLNYIKTLITNIDNNKFLSCFEKIEIIIKNIEDLEKINQLINGTDLPIVINLSELPEEYVLDNIDRINLNLKKHNTNKISYKIRECLSDSIAHYEENSYTLEQVKQVLKFEKEITSSIKKFNLTPFEQIMFIYDYVKDRYFKYSTEDEDYIESRDMARIITGDKIVCLGFATLFKNLLDQFDINNQIIILDSTKKELSSHARNRVTVKDEKYNLDHILYFDATWDCKNDNDNSIDENKYKCFAKERSYFLTRDNGEIIESKSLPFYIRKDDDYSFLLSDRLMDNLLEIKRLFEKINWKKYFDEKNIPTETMEKVNRLMSHNICNIYRLKDDHEFCIYIYKECCMMLNRKISDDTFLRCLYNVRKVENYLHPEKYSFIPEELIDIYFDRVLPNYNNSQKLLYRIMNNLDEEIENKLKQFKIEEELHNKSIFVKDGPKILKK